MSIKPNMEINKLCKRCLNKCKQNKESILVSCPKFKEKPKQLVFSFKSN